MKKLILAALAVITLTVATPPALGQPAAPEATIQVDAGAPVAVPAETPTAADPKPADATEAQPAATPVPEEPAEVVGLLGKLISAAKSGNWSLAFILAVMLLVWGVRKGADTSIGAKLHLAWFTTKWGGWILVLVGTTAGTIATALLADKGISWSLVSSAITIGLAAAGAHELHGDSGLKGA